jgi:hypothetical protein
MMDKFRKPSKSETFLYLWNMEMVGNRLLIELIVINIYLWYTEIIVLISVFASTYGLIF